MSTNGALIWFISDTSCQCLKTKAGCLWELLSSVDSTQGKGSNRVSLILWDFSHALLWLATLPSAVAGAMFLPKHACIAQHDRDAKERAKQTLGKTLQTTY